MLGIASFANKRDCTSTPGGFARITYSVLKWIRSVKVINYKQTTFTTIVKPKSKVQSPKSQSQDQKDLG